ncbi:MAG: glycoside hydrolase family 3 C-terminal domain-containing protein [Bacteroidia bacterium]
MIASACEAFHAAGKKVVIVLNIGGVVETASWKTQPDAIVLAWQGGQEGGNSVADIMSGKVNPSGKLPMTFPVHVADHASNANFPLDGEPMSMTSLLFSGEAKTEGEKIKNKDYTNYEEGIYVGYRHFDKANLEVSYPFGYGLSYSDFEFSDLVSHVENDTVHISLKVRNTGDHAGKEVVQIYVSKPNAAIDRPEKELKAFAKSRNLQPGEEEEIIFRLPVSELRYWDEEKAGWALEKGQYEIKAGASSRDIRSAVGIDI